MNRLRESAGVKNPPGGRLRLPGDHQDMRPRAPKGFTLLELAITLFLVALFSAMAINSFQAPKDKGERERARMRLSAAELEIARLATDDPSEDLPTNLSEQVPVSGISVYSATTAVESNSQISLGRLASNPKLAAAVTPVGDGTCLIVVVGYDTSGWAVAPQPQAGCRADNAAITEASVSGTPESPASITLT